MRCRAGGYVLVMAGGVDRPVCVRWFVRPWGWRGPGRRHRCPVVLVLIVSWPMMRVSAIDYGAREPPPAAPAPGAGLDLELQAKIHVGSVHVSLLARISSTFQ